MKKYNFIIGFLSCSFLLLNVACDEDFLNDTAAPISEFSPDNAFLTPEGLESGLIPARRFLREGDFGYDPINRTEYYWTDISYVSLQNPNIQRDASLALNPFSNPFGTRLFVFWEQCFEFIKDLNIVINRIDVPEFESEEQRNAILAEAFFHRAYWYYRLVHRFKDVPWVGQEITEPRLDFTSFTQEAILTQIRNDLEFAVQWLPEDVVSGEVNRAAGNHLLAKVYLSLGQFEDAVTATDRVINDGRYALMTTRFGNSLFAGDPEYDVLWDLHRKENADLAVNTEGILIAPDALNLPGNGDADQRGSGTNRFWMPIWWQLPDAEYLLGAEEDAQSLALGRGVGFARPNDHFSYTMRGEDPNDRRYSDTNWWGIEDFIHNEPGSPLFGQTVLRETVGVDTIARLWSFPYYKLHSSPDVPGTRNDGGFRNYYVFRLAETYLLRAEAFWWMGRMQEAADDINVVRARAGAAPRAAGDITIDLIMDERALELYSEEPRSTELARVSFIFAFLNRGGYSLETISQSSYMYDKMRRTCPELFMGLESRGTVYGFAPHNIYWPIPQTAIDANSLGRINQNIGYPGAELNVPPRTEVTPED